MSNSTIRIEQMIISLRAAITTTALDEAVGALYKGIMPLLTPYCDRVLRRANYLGWRDAEDLASETLVRAMPALRNGRCPDVANGGLLRFLATIAHRALLDAHRRDGHDSQCASDASLLDAAALLASESLCDDDSAEFSAHSVAAFLAAYEAAVAALRPQVGDTWRVVVEQETPMIDAAAQLGVDRATVWRRVRRARHLMAQHLARFAP